MCDHAGVSRAELISRATKAVTGQAAVVLRGPAGIGKSHAAAEIADRVAARGSSVFRVVGGLASQQLTFGALLPLLPVDGAPAASELGLAQLLRRELVTSPPALVVVDDINHLDPQSAALIEALVLVDELRLLATERTGVGGEATVHALSTFLDDRAQRIEVGPLTAAESSDLLHHWFGPGGLRI